MLERGVKLALVGSLQDQVVPLYSAIMTSVSHPNILRSIYIDGHIYSDNDFIINLVTFALNLRNAGLSDHGLLTHLSEVLAGNLYAFEGGHSTIYEELNVYTTLVQYLFETDPLGKATLTHNNFHENDEKENLAHMNHAKTQVTTTSSFPITTSKPISVKLSSFQAKNIKNPYYLTWAMCSICNDDKILKNDTWSNQLDHLRYLYDSWEPTNPKLRSVKLRLQPFTFSLL